VDFRAEDNGKVFPAEDYAATLTPDEQLAEHERRHSSSTSLGVGSLYVVALRWLPHFSHPLQHCVSHLRFKGHTKHNHLAYLRHFLEATPARFLIESSSWKPATERPHQPHH